MFRKVIHDEETINALHEIAKDNQEAVIANNLRYFQGLVRKAEKQLETLLEKYPFLKEVISFQQTLLAEVDKQETVDAKIAVFNKLLVEAIPHFFNVDCIYSHIIQRGQDNFDAFFPAKITASLHLKNKQELTDFINNTSHELKAKHNIEDWQEVNPYPTSYHGFNTLIIPYAKPDAGKVFGFVALFSAEGHNFTEKELIIASHLAYIFFSIIGRISLFYRQQTGSLRIRIN